MEQENQKFEIRDLRQKEQYITDDEFLNGYARFLGVYAVGVYNSLCRHANKSQMSWPSINFISEELSISRNKTINGIKFLEFWNIIKKIRIGKSANNRYVLYHKKLWRPINLENLKAYSEVHHINFTNLQDKLHKFTTRTSNSKETHIKELKERKDFENKKRPFYGTMPMRKRYQKWEVYNKGEWREYGDKESKIEWK